MPASHAPIRRWRARATADAGACNLPDLTRRAGCPSRGRARLATAVVALTVVVLPAIARYRTPHPGAIDVRPCGGIVSVPDREDLLRRVTMIVSSRAGDSAAGVLRAVCRAGLVMLTVWLAGAGVAGASRWRVERTPKGVGDLSAVSCYSARACTAVGGELALRSTGSKWATQRTATPVASRYWQFSGVSCPSATTCFAVGLRNPRRASRFVALAERWDGSTWHQQRIPIPDGRTNDSDLAAVSCTSPTACTAVGDDGTYSNGDYRPLIERWNGETWSVQRAPAGSRDLTSVSCTARALCTAVGEGLSLQLLTDSALRWSGGRWTISPAPSSYGVVGFDAVSCVSAKLCVWAGGLDGGSGPNEPVAGRWDGAVWTQPTFVSGNDYAEYLTDVSCTSTRACIAVALDGAIYRWNGARWASERIPRQSFEHGLDGVSCVSRTVCVAVGDNGFVERRS